MGKIRVILALIFLSITIVLAQESHETEIEEGENLVKSKISCGKLSDEQLEAIGEYYMEQMHPGEAHELMDNMMGGEGSESLKQVHINMARRLYCNDKLYIGYGMMSSSGMMGGGMMSNYPLNYGYANSSWNIFWIVFLAAVICLIAWIIYRLSISKKISSETPSSILQKRFARGEITKNQFDKIKKELEE